MSCYVLHRCWTAGRHCHIHSLTFLRNEQQTDSRRLANRYAKRYTERTTGTASCQAIPIVCRHLERMPVSLSASFGSLRPASQTLRYARGDSQDTSQARSREVFSPNVYIVWRIVGLKSTKTVQIFPSIRLDKRNFLWYC